MKNQIIAGILSFLIPGVGHWYLKLWTRGVLWFLGAIVTGTILVIILPKGNENIFRMFGFVYCFIAGFDAQRQTIKLNSGLK